MSQLTDALEEARSNAQALHKKIQGTTAKDHASIRANARSVDAEALELARSIKSLLDSQRADAKQHLKDAVSELEAASKDAQAITTASGTELKPKNTEALAHVRSAAQHISQAVAAQRASLVRS